MNAYRNRPVRVITAAAVFCVGLITRHGSASASCATGTDCTLATLEKDIADANAVLAKAAPIDVVLAAAQIANAYAACLATAATGNPGAAVDCTIGSVAATRDRTQLALLTIIGAANQFEAQLVYNSLTYLLDMAALGLRDLSNVNCFLSNPIACPPSIVPTRSSLVIDTPYRRVAIESYASTDIPIVASSNVTSTPQPEGTDPMLVRLSFTLQESPNHCGDVSAPFHEALTVTVVAGTDTVPHLEAEPGDIYLDKLSQCFA